MNNIADANATEMRGWVMLMLQRAAENVNPSECNDPAVLLACSLGSDSCPAACQKNADEKTNEEDTANQGTIDGLPIAGDLSIAVADYSDTIKSAPSVGTLVFNAVDFKASEKVTIESVKLERTGLSDKSAIKGVWFEKDGVAVSARATLTSDGTATTRFYNGYSVNGTETLDFVVELNDAKGGSEVAFNIVGATSTAKNVSANTKTSTYRTTNYKVATINFAYNGAKTEAGTTYKIGEKNSYEIGRFQISNETKGTEDKDIILKSLKLKNNEAIDMAATFKNVIVTRDSKTVSSKVELSSKDMVIYFNDDVLASGKKGIYTIFAEVANLERPGEAVQLYLNKTSELVANEATSNFRVAYDDAMNTSENLMSQKYIFNGGKVTFTTASNFPKTVEAAASSTDVEIAKGTLTVAEPIKLEGLKVTALLKKEIETSGKFRDPIKTLKVEIGGSTYTAKEATYSEGTTVGKKDVATWEFSDEMYVSRTSDIKVLVSINSDAKAADKVEFNNINGVSFSKLTYENSDKSYAISTTKNNDQIAGIIQVSNVTPTPGKFFITNKATSTQKVVVGNSEPVVIFDGEITTNKEKVSVNDLILAGAFKFNAASAGTCSDGDDSKNTQALCEASNYTYTKGATLADSTCKNGATDKYTASTTLTVDAWHALPESAQKASCEDGNLTWTANATEGLKAGEQISLTLDVNGTPYADAVYSPSNTDVKFSNLGDVVSGTPMKIKITAQPNINTVGSITFKVSAEGTDTQGNKATASSASAVTLSITESASITVANSAASSTVEKAGANAELVKFSTTVKNGSLSLDKMYVKLESAVAALKNQTVSAEFDGKRVDGSFDANGQLISFEGLTDTLEAGKHDFVLKTDINADEGAVALVVSKVLINGDSSDIAAKGTSLNVSKMFGKSYPVLSLVKADSNNNEVTIKIANPSDSDEDITVKGIRIVQNDVATASLNDQDLDVKHMSTDATHSEYYDIADGKRITLAAGESTELRLQADTDGTHNYTAQLKGILVTVDNKDYAISDSYTNVAKWADLKITYKK